MYGRASLRIVKVGIFLKGFLRQVRSYNCYSHPKSYKVSMSSSSVISNGLSMLLVSQGEDAEKWKKIENERIKLWHELKEKNALRESEKASEISVTLEDGAIFEGVAGETTPAMIAESTLKASVFSEVLVAKLDQNELWDLDRPLERNCRLAFLTFEDDEGKAVFWHSSAHVMGEAMERLYSALLCYGPPIEQGFYYDMQLPNGSRISSNDFPQIKKKVIEIVKEKQKFERLEMSKEDLLKMFAYNPFKLRILNEKVKTPSTTVYRCGSLIDLCRGPHVRHTGKIKALELTNNSSCFWEGKCEAEELQRLYGISFPQAKLLTEWKTIQEEAAKRDHRKIGRNQELFFFHEMSPGSCFFLPKGTHIYNTLISHIKGEYWKRGFQEVITPNIYNIDLWKQSGHWQHYAENMFAMEARNEEKFALKPMNCPGHCLIFALHPRSWRELPLRLADFGVLHRNEISGALTGLTRVRRFQQDDAHIFCSVEQVEGEIKSALDFLKHTLDLFGFSFQLHLSTRPADYMGLIEDWNSAEKQLENALTDFGLPWKVNKGDGAFYGPKIDIIILDALKRKIQCSTIQLDFQLPQRFDLKFMSGVGSGSSENKEDCNEFKKPVIIHRAILGSVERMMSVLIEHFAGKWPFWLSPRQVAVIPVNQVHNEYAAHVHAILHQEGFMTEAKIDSGETLNKKIRNAQLDQFNFIVVVGDREVQNESVCIRSRENKVIGEFGLKEAISRFQRLKKEKVLKSEENF